jgi:hypothetical protein
MSERTSYRSAARVSLINWAMVVGRLCAGRSRPVTVGDIQEALACSDSTARRFLAAYRSVYPDVAALQDAGGFSAAAGQIVEHAPAHAANEAVDAAARAAAARADTFDNVDPEYSDEAGA